jgi:hypothetical protein
VCAHYDTLPTHKNPLLQVQPLLVMGRTCQTISLSKVSCSKLCSTVAFQAVSDLVDSEHGHYLCLVGSFASRRRAARTEIGPVARLVMTNDGRNNLRLEAKEKLDSPSIVLDYLGSLFVCVRVDWWGRRKLNRRESSCSLLCVRAPRYPRTDARRLDRVYEFLEITSKRPNIVHNRQPDRQPIVFPE